MEWLL